MDAAFIFSLAALVSGFFCLGGVSLLFFLRRTRILKLMLLFLLSLVLVDFGFWLQHLGTAAGYGTEGFADAGITAVLFLAAGLIINIITVPHLSASVCYRSVEKPIRQLLWIWNSVLIAAGMLYPFLPDPAPVILVMNVQLFATIAASIIFIATQYRNIPNPGFRKAALAFLILSVFFLVMLVLDMLLTRLRIRQLYFLDSLSLPVYIIALNISSFIFAGKLLDSGPLLMDNRITDTCRQRYALTEREAEIIETLFQGHSNRELADLLFISKKTVENHLYNIYQKMEVKNRVQLIGTLKSWRGEGHEES